MYDDKLSVKSDAGRDKLIKQSSTMVDVDPADFNNEEEAVIKAKSSAFKEKIDEKEISLGEDSGNPPSNFQIKEKKTIRKGAITLTLTIRVWTTARTQV